MLKSELCKVWSRQKLYNEIYLQKSASIQPRTSPSKFGGKIQFNIHSPSRSWMRWFRRNHRFSTRKRRSTRSRRRRGSRCSRPKLPARSLRRPGSRRRSGAHKEWSEYWIEFSPQTSRGSFSAVSTPIFASKYALESSRRDLHNALLCTGLKSQIFRQKSPKRFRDWINESSLIQSQTLRILHFFCEFLVNFFPDFAPNPRK